jgi:hypothetical protein
MGNDRINDLAERTTKIKTFAYSFVELTLESREILTKRI